MDYKKWFEDHLKTVQATDEYRAEDVIIRTTDRICKLLKDKNISKKELAKRLDVSAPFITKILNGENNFTIETLVKIADRIGCKMEIDFHPVGYDVKTLHVYSNAIKDYSKKIEKINRFEREKQYICGNEIQESFKNTRKKDLICA